MYDNRRNIIRRRRKKKARGRPALLAVIAGLSLYMAVFAFKAFGPGGRAHPVSAMGSGSLYSQNAVLMRLENGRVLYEKNSGERIYPASLTKLMTVLVILEQFEDLDHTVTLSGQVFDELRTSGASMAGFLPGEQLTLRDLLYGCMLPSGAEAALGLACAIAGSEENFAELMNEKAAALGMGHTHFTNATGLHDPGHYSTVSDMALLLRQGLENPDFRELFTTFCYQTGPTSQHPEGLYLSSTMNGLMAAADCPEGVTLLGGKTGYTEEAGLCLASLAEKDGQEFIAVTAGAPGSHETAPRHLEDALRLYGLADCV
ncbi:D-alanyl-D-alanine carboxypeptidase family protein [Eubacterium sp. 1001713B170207_170306_E7]|uniref:D-alanyl-D-alanine carboxypeptidase family protein n=1 Tax=Eubacterium sp. 1001713B170207_170306_E7 TaxID=2787097 RepID=UPI00189818C0|nr:D-alanyl-D-alanine carboxypeptidase family protein [Eubacterium sp. 1001713B170207_170306_E7]